MLNDIIDIGIEEGIDTKFLDETARINVTHRIIISLVRVCTGVFRHCPNCRIVNTIMATVTVSTVVHSYEYCDIIVTITASKLSSLFNGLKMD